jgi:H+/Cl- antiporter ClcA
MHPCEPGGSLGPEAALLSLCGSTTSWLAANVFGCKGQRLRNCALMGMTAGLAAFFGVALGGACLLASCCMQASLLHSAWEARSQLSGPRCQS